MVVGSIPTAGATFIIKIMNLVILTTKKMTNFFHKIKLAVGNRKPLLLEFVLENSEPSS